jgi:DNA repair protein RadC
MFNHKEIQKDVLKETKPREPKSRTVRGSGPSSWEEDRLERLRRLGPAGLSAVELLTCVLGPGGVVSAAQLARQLMSAYGSLDHLAAVSVAVLQRRFGIGPARAGRLSSAFELGQRALRPPLGSGLVVRGPQDVHALLRDEFRGLDRERFLALYLDTRHRILAVDTVSLGSLNASLVHPREVFKPAVNLSAAAIIVAHNHPSGCSRPSADDLDLTARLTRAGRLLGIALVDHLVVGDEEITSIREFGWPAGNRD